MKSSEFHKQKKIKKKKKSNLRDHKKKGPQDHSTFFNQKKNPLNIFILEGKINDSMPSMYDFYSMTWHSRVVFCETRILKK